MNSEYVSNSRPSGFGVFFRGFGSGVLSGALMIGILFGVSAIAASLPFLSGTFIGIAGAHLVSSSALGLLGSALLTATTTGLFSGVMAVKNAVFSQPAMTALDNERSTVAIATPSQSQTIAPTILMADTAEQPATKSWRAETGRNGDAQGRIQQILANGSMGDKDRASAILAAREAAETTQSRA